MNEQRPKITQEMIKEAVQNLAKSNQWDSKQIDDVVSQYRSYKDGYELAKDLESYCGWDIDVCDVEELDSIENEVRKVHKKACLTWQKTHNIQPKLPVGTVTKKGEITGVYESEAACYLIREHGETNESRRLIIKFEDLELISQAESAIEWVNGISHPAPQLPE